MAPLDPENGFFLLQKRYEDALAGNRTWASRVAGENSTTEPPVPLAGMEFSDLAIVLGELLHLPLSSVVYMYVEKQNQKKKKKKKRKKERRKRAFGLN